MQGRQRGGVRRTQQKRQMTQTVGQTTVHKVADKTHKVAKLNQPDTRRPFQIYAFLMNNIQKHTYSGSYFDLLMGVCIVKAGRHLAGAIPDSPSRAVITAKREHYSH